MSVRATSAAAAARSVGVVVQAMRLEPGVSLALLIAPGPLSGLQRRRLIPAPLPDAAALGRKPSLPGQWVDLPPPLAGSLKEPFEIKVYEIDDVERLQRHRLPPREDEAKVREAVVRLGALGCQGWVPWGVRAGSPGVSGRASRWALWAPGGLARQLLTSSFLSTALSGCGEGRNQPGLSLSL